MLSLYCTFIFRAIWIVEGAPSMFHVLVIASHISRAILEAICPLLTQNSQRQIPKVTRWTPL